MSRSRVEPLAEATSHFSVRISEVHVGGEHAKTVEVVRGTRIISICVLESAKVIQRGYLFKVSCRSREAGQRDR